MSKFFKKYTYSEKAQINQLFPIPKTNEYIAIGSKGDKALVLRLDHQHNIVWEKELDYNGQIIYLHKGDYADGGTYFYFNLIGSVQISSNRRRHLLIQINIDTASVMNMKVLHHKSSRNCVGFVSLPDGELMLSGWNSVGGDRVEVNRIARDLNSATTRIFKMGQDDQMTCATHYTTGALIGGGRRNGVNWEGFLLRVDVNHNTRRAISAEAYRAIIPGVGINEIDALLATGLHDFIAAIEVRGSDIFFARFGFQGASVTTELPVKCNLGKGAGVRKMIWKNGLVYALCYETSGDRRSFVMKLDLAVGDDPGNAIHWAKTFNIGSSYTLMDIVSTSDGLSLVGTITPDDGHRKPLVISTDDDLQCCFTETLPRTTASKHNQPFLIEALAVNETQATNNISTPPITLLTTNAQIEDLCAPDVVKGSCRPAFVAWNTLEPRSRSNNLTRPLQAQVRDGMWMLSRQWQWGGFEGEDGGSIVHSKLSLQYTNIDRYTQLQGDKHLHPYGGESPLEYQVEKQAVDIIKDYLLRLETGKHWQRLLEHHFSTSGFGSAINQYQEGFLLAYKFELPQRPPDTDEDDLIEYLTLEALEDTWAILNAADGRALDGAKLLTDVQSGISLSHAFIQSTHQAALSSVLANFNTWIKQNYYDDLAVPPSWSAKALEHQFMCQAPNTYSPTSAMQLQGKAYPGGHLDWYSVDAKMDGRTFGDATGLNFQDASVTDTTEVRIPAKLSFPGMPNPRWWEMEDHQIDFGDMLTNKTDLSKMFLLDFILNYADNWYLIPLQLDVGTLIDTEGIEVRDNFGIRTFVRPANTLDRLQGGTLDWELFKLDALTDKDTPDSFLFLPPSTAIVQEGEPVERVNFIRDEMANMVWGIEQVVPNGLSGGLKGQEASMALQQLYPAAAAASNAGTSSEKPVLKYGLATTIDENWIPFIPVHSGDSNRSIQLQRARIQRALGGFSNTVHPRTLLLKSPSFPYLVHEEEVPKAGKIITGKWQRTRWFNGKTYVWYGYQATTGRGGGASGLKFDQLLER